VKEALTTPILGEEQSGMRATLMVGIAAGILVSGIAMPLALGVPAAVMWGSLGATGALTATDMIASMA
jgi:hypothetical protein